MKKLNNNVCVVFNVVICLVSLYSPLKFHKNLVFGIQSVLRWIFRVRQRGRHFKWHLRLCWLSRLAVSLVSSGRKCQKDNKVYLICSNTLASWIPNKQKSFPSIKFVETTVDTAVNSPMDNNKYIVSGQGIKKSHYICECFKQDPGLPHRHLCLDYQAPPPAEPCQNNF